MDALPRLTGREVCVIGPVPHDLPLVDIYISANEHGAKIADFIVAMDDRYGDTKTPMRDYLRQFSDAPILSPFDWADFRLEGWPGAPRRILSGMAAVWAASEMDADHITIVGMNGYGGKPGALKDAGLVARNLRCPVTLIGGGALRHYFK